MQRVEQNEGTQDLCGGLCRPIDSCLSTTLDRRLEKAAELFARPFTAILWAATFTNRSARALNCSGKPRALSHLEGDLRSAHLLQRIPRTGVLIPVSILHSVWSFR